MSPDTRRSRHGMGDWRSSDDRGRRGRVGRYLFSRGGTRPAFPRSRRGSGFDGRSSADRARRRDARARSRQSWPGRVVYRICWTVAFAGAKLMFRLHVEGKENFPRGPFVLAPVHRSFIDTPMAGLITRRRMRFMGKENLWENRMLGMFLSIMGGFPVERGTADRAALRAATDVLALGEPLVMFPEGTRQSGARVRRSDVLDGPAFVAARAGVPLVPVGFGGTARALPLGSRIPRPVRIVAVVGNPMIPPPKLGGRVPRRSVRQTTDRLSAELDDLYSEARVLAGDESAPGVSVWWRRARWRLVVSRVSGRWRGVVSRVSGRWRGAVSGWRGVSGRWRGVVSGWRGAVSRVSGGWRGVVSGVSGRWRGAVSGLGRLVPGGSASRWRNLLRPSSDAQAAQDLTGAD